MLALGRVEESTVGAYLESECVRLERSRENMYNAGVYVSLFCMAAQSVCSGSFSALLFQLVFDGECRYVFHHVRNGRQSGLCDGE
jgi:hypothetical protein